MPGSHVIAAADWPEVSSLINRERSGQFSGSGSDRPSPPLIGTRSVLLVDDLEPGGNARARTLRDSSKFIQDIFCPDSEIKSIRIGIARSGFEPEEYTELIDLDESTSAKVLEEIEGLSLEGEVERIEKVGRRIKILFNEPRPAYRVVSDPDQERVFVNASSVRTTNEVLTVYAGSSVTTKLVAGTSCQVSHVPARGMVVTEFESYPEPAINETQVIYDSTPSNCSRQVVKSGSGSECSACNPGDTPDGFSVSLGFYSSLWPEFFRLISPSGSEHGDSIRLIHDTDCRWESDWIANGIIKLTLEIFKAENNPPHAQVKIIGNASFYSDGLSISYWSDLPFDSLAANKFYRVTHESSGTTALSRENAPSCLIIKPYVEACHNAGTSNLPSSWDCVSVWKTSFKGLSLSTQQRTKTTFADDCVVGCEWPFTADQYSNGLFVYYKRNTCGENTWSLEATATYRGNGHKYVKTVSGSTVPSCLSHTLVYAGDSLPDGIPHEITIRPWQA